MAKILVIEDDLQLCEAITEWLVHERYTVESAANGLVGYDLLLASEFDAVLLDWDLPGLSGLEILRKYRESGGLTPILMLTQKTSIDERTTGLDTGADDYLPKPFHLKELSARLRALLRRTSGRATNELRVGDMILEPMTNSVVKDGKTIQLQPKEYALLEFLMRHPNELFSADALITRVWHSDSEVTSEAVRSTIKRLRKKLEADDDQPLIESVYSLGYKLVVRRGGPPGPPAMIQ